MTSLTLAGLLHASILATGADSYADAHRTSTETGKPMVVMVGAESSGPFQKMNKVMLPQARKRGLLKKVTFAIVNWDRERKLARKLTGGGPIRFPQLLMFRKTPKGWARRKLVGGQSLETVEKFINQGLALDEATRKAVRKEKRERASKKKRAAAKVADRPKAQPVSTR